MMRAIVPLDAPARAVDPLADDAGQAVLRADVSGEAKLAWRFLRLRSRTNRGPLKVSALEVAADQGRTSDKSGRRSLTALAEVAASLLTNTYHTGLKLTAEIAATIRCLHDKILPIWNYRILPNSL